jgi:hypothetical protein
MKTYRSSMNNGLKKGIRPMDVITRNTALFTDCRQARVTPVGLEGYTPDVNDILDPKRKFYSSADGVTEISITRKWPFPQVFLTDVGVFIGAIEGLYLVTDPSPSRYPDLLLTSYGSTSTLWPWVCIPILGYPAFTSGSRFVYYDAANSTYTVVS